MQKNILKSPKKSLGMSQGTKGAGCSARHTSIIIVHNKEGKSNH